MLLVDVACITLSSFTSPTSTSVFAMERSRSLSSAFTCRHGWPYPRRLIHCPHTHYQTTPTPYTSLNSIQSRFHPSHSAMEPLKSQAAVRASHILVKPFPNSLDIRSLEHLSGPGGLHGEHTDTSHQGGPGIGLVHGNPLLDRPITHVPQIVSLFESHRVCYADTTVSPATRMQCAKALAFALLTHYYPASEGSTTEPCPLGPVAQHGMNFIVATEDESDKWNFAPSTANAKKGKRRGNLTKKQKDNIAAAEYNYGISYLANLQWHRIEAENMAAFVVHRETGPITHNATAEKLPHTYLAIMIDESESEYRLRFSTENTLHRSDVLTDLFCRHTRIQEGRGILFHGPHVEIYDFSRGVEWVHYEEADEAVQDTEPRMALADGLPGLGKLVLDVRVTGLEELDGVFRQVVAREVVLGGVGEVGKESTVGVDAAVGLATDKTDGARFDDGDDDNGADANATDADAEGEDEF